MLVDMKFLILFLPFIESYSVLGTKLAECHCKSLGSKHVKKSPHFVNSKKLWMCAMSLNRSPKINVDLLGSNNEKIQIYTQEVVLL